MGQQGSLPYNIGEEVKTYEHSLFQMHDGVRIEDQRPVSIFAFDVNKHGKSLGVAKNALRRMKILRHPNIVEFIDGIELPNMIYIVTEQVEPLVFEATDKHDKQQMHGLCLGLSRIASAVSWLNNDVAAVHGNVSPSALFRTVQHSEWKLGGLEFLFTRAEAQELRGVPAYVSESRDFFCERYISPEYQSEEWNTVARMPPYTTDCFGLGCVIYEMYNGAFTEPQQLMKPGKIPPGLLTSYRSLLSAHARNRLNASKLLDLPFFKSNPLVQSIDFLEQLSLRTPGQQEKFFGAFPNLLKQFPKIVCELKVLPLLLTGMTYGSSMGCFSHMLNAVLLIGKNLPQERYNEVVVPAVVNLFSNNERSVRMNLLEHLHEFADNLSAELVTSKIFPAVFSGFRDNYAPLREASVKSLVHLVPKLKPQKIDTTVVEILQKMQRDNEPRIRTNTIYCSAKLMSYFSPQVRERVATTQIAAGLTDAVPHARLAAVVSVSAALEYLSAKAIAKFVMPKVAALTIDVARDVRAAALRCITQMVTRLQQNSDNMDRRGNAISSGEKPKTSSSSSSSSFSASSSSKRAAADHKASTSDTADDGGGSNSWGSWALSGIASKVAELTETADASSSSAAAAATAPDTPSRSGQSFSSSDFTKQGHLKAASTPQQPSTRVKNEFKKPKPRVAQKPKVSADEWLDEDMRGSATSSKASASTSKAAAKKRQSSTDGFQDDFFGDILSKKGGGAAEEVDFTAMLSSKSKPKAAKPKPKTRVTKAKGGMSLGIKKKKPLVTKAPVDDDDTFAGMDDWGLGDLNINAAEAEPEIVDNADDWGGLGDLGLDISSGNAAAPTPTSSSSSSMSSMALSSKKTAPTPRAVKKKRAAVVAVQGDSDDGFGDLDGWGDMLNSTTTTTTASKPKPKAKPMKKKERVVRAKPSTSTSNKSAVDDWESFLN
jgi:SCY1-like protein 1